MGLMKTAISQIKITLPPALKKYVQSRAQRFDLPLAGYLKHLILKDIEQTEFPVFTPSAKTEKKIRWALENLNKFEQIEDLKGFFGAL